MGHKLQTQNKMQKPGRASRRDRFCDLCGQQVPKTVRLGWPQQGWTGVFLQVCLTLRQRWSWSPGLIWVGGSRGSLDKQAHRTCLPVRLCACGVCMHVRVRCVRVQ